MGPDLEACLDPEDVDRFRSFGRTLQHEIAAAVPEWIERQVAPRCLEFLGSTKVDASELAEEFDRIPIRVTERLDRMVSAPLTESVSGPLEQIRLALAPTTAWVIEQRGTVTGGVAGLVGDPLELGPITFRDLGDAVHDAGIQWGAAKAFLHHQMRSDHDGSSDDRRVVGEGEKRDDR